jgi:hypothetical protein
MSTLKQQETNRTEKLLIQGIIKNSIILKAILIQILLIIFQIEIEPKIRGQLEILTTPNTSQNLASLDNNINTDSKNLQYNDENVENTVNLNRLEDKIKNEIKINNNQTSQQFTQKRSSIQTLNLVATPIIGATADLKSEGLFFSNNLNNLNNIFNKNLLSNYSNEQEISSTRMPFSHNNNIENKGVEKNLNVLTSNLNNFSNFSYLVNNLNDLNKSANLNNISNFTPSSFPIFPPLNYVPGPRPLTKPVTSAGVLTTKNQKF